MSDKQGWTGGAQTRGTFDILWTCVSTLALCVWTAVHPNILLVPSSKRSLLTRLGMMVVAIVFPEIIISSAWRQLRSSQWLRTEINLLYQDKRHDRLQVCVPRTGQALVLCKIKLTLELYSVPTFETVTIASQM
jgi:hypothetical protein